MNNLNNKVVWLTGLSGSGKTTIANYLHKRLKNLNIKSHVLDADIIRSTINSDLGFSDKDKAENIRRLSELAKLIMDLDYIVIVASISPFKESRILSKSIVGEFNYVEVYVDTPIDICASRDPKKLYKSYREKKISNMSGLDGIYDIPEFPDFIFKYNEDFDIQIDQLIKKIR